MRLRIGDIIEINGREMVVYAKVYHWACGIQSRIADVNRYDMFGGMVVTTEVQEGRVKRRDLALAARVCQRLEWSILNDVRRARIARVKAIHRARASVWARRSHRLMEMAERESAVIP